MTTQLFQSGGVQTTIVLPQVIYLDFDGELTSYNGEILTVDNVTVEDSGLTAERIAAITAMLNQQFHDQNVEFVTQRPACGDYSTIYIGKTASFAPYGSFAGLAETVDSGNKVRNDNAFVMLDSFSSNDRIADVIAHEAGHLIGTLDHGSKGISKYGYQQKYQVFSGEISSGLILDSADGLLIWSGGTASAVTVNSNGWLTVFSGGTAADITFSGGRLLVYAAANTYIRGTDRGSSFEIENGYASNFTVGSCFNLTVCDGGSADRTVIEDSGFLYISSGGTANSTTIKSGGKLLLCSGGSAYNTAVSGGYFCMTVAPDTYIQGRCNGSAFKMKNGYVSGFTADQYSWMYVSSGGTAAKTAVNASGGAWVYSGGTASGTVVKDGGCLCVSECGTASKNTVKNKGELHIFSGGTAVDTLIESGGYLYVSSIGAVNSTIIYSGGYLNVSSGGTADRTTIDTSGNFVISSGGTANSTTVNGGWMDILSGGTVNCTTLQRGGLYVSGGVTANRTVVNGGWMDILSGGTANSTTVNSRCSLRVSSGGTANNTVLESSYVLPFDHDGVTMFVFSGGTANSTTLNSVCYMYIQGGTVNNIIMSCGGYMEVSSDSMLSGSLQMSGGVVNVYQGATIDFTVADQADSSTALINDWSLIHGGNKAYYTLTVGADQASGTYALAGGAADFANTVTVKTVDNTELGTLAVGETKEFSGVGYTLAKDSGTLTLTIGEIVIEHAKGDLDGNGLADVVMTIDQGTHPYNGATGAWIIQEDQTPVWGDLSTRNDGWEIFGLGRTSDKATADVYIKNTENVVGAWVTDSQGKVSRWETVGSFGADAQVLGLGDFNGDGQSDLLLRNTNGAVGCYFTDGGGWNYFQSLGDEWKLCGIGDLNGDGLDDVVLKHDAGFAGTWLTQSDGTIAWADLDTLSAGFEIVGCGDFNGDNVDDVLLQNGSYFGAWIVQGGSVSSWMGLGEAAGTVEQIADFNGDGTDDLRVRSSDGAIGALLVKGADTLDWRYYGSVGDEWSTSLAAL